MNAERVVLNEKRLIEVIQVVLETRRGQKFVFSEGYTSPEEPYINLLKEHGKRISNPAFAVNAVFLSTSLVRGNRTRPFLENISDADKIANYAWIFDPAQVLQRGDKATQKACLEFFRPPGYCRDAIPKWYHNSQVIMNNGGDVRNFFNKFDGDANTIAKAIYVRNRAKIWEKEGTFWGFGPKLSHLAIQWISLHGLYDFKNIEHLPVDFQIARIAIQTDALTLTSEANADEVIARGLMPGIRKICLEKGIDPREVSQALWTLGSEGCNNKRHNDCPLANICVRYITSKSYQRTGRFNSQDEGRYE
jgi:hypothetical protein